MFNRRTVFLVGAGASAELGLPVGSGLMEILREKLFIGSRSGFDVDFGDPIIIDAVRHIGQTQDIRDLNPFWQAGRSIAAGLVQAISIDNYLDTHNDNDKIVLLGKLGIALSILQAEGRSRLFSERRQQSALVNVSDSWLPSFFRMAHEDVRRVDARRMFENVSMIVFNYDRCIEQYLTDAVMTHFLFDREEAEEVVSTLRIIHPYGKVGDLPTTGRGGVPFGSDIRGVDLVRVAQGIRTFTEQIEDGDLDRAEARNAMSNAEVAVYLGLSYGSMNMRYLATSRLDLPRIFGTSFGMSWQNEAVVTNQIVESFAPTNLEFRFEPTLQSQECRQFLDSHRLPILEG